MQALPLSGLRRLTGVETLAPDMRTQLGPIPVHNLGATNHAELCAIMTAYVPLRGIRYLLANLALCVTFVRT